MVVWGPNSSALELWWSNYTAWKTSGGVPLKIDLLETYWKPTIFSGYFRRITTLSWSPQVGLLQTSSLSPVDLARARKVIPGPQFLAAHSGVQICWMVGTQIFLCSPFSWGNDPIWTQPPSSPDLEIGNFVLMGCGFKYFVCLPLFGEDSHVDSYFSDGLKPPTRFHLMGCVKRCLL